MSSRDRVHLVLLLVSCSVLLVGLAAGHSANVNAVAQARLQAGALQCASRGQFNKAVVKHSWLSNSISANGKRAIHSFDAEIASTACTIDSEVTEGPYYVNNELQRSDIRDDEPGVPLILKFTVVDVSNCSVLPYATVELWHTNSTGSYAHFTGIDPDTGSMTPSATCVDSSGTPEISSSASATGSSSSSLSSSSKKSVDGVTELLEVNAPPPMPSGPRPPMPSGGGGGGGTTCMTDYLTFNRGWQVTDDEGVVQMTTNYPGFYTGRTPHIHIMIRTSDNTVRHIGQLFFNETTTAEVYELGDYAAHISKVGDIWLRLASDGIYTGSGQTPVNLVQVNENDLSEGVVGAVTIYIDSSASRSISSTNYLTGGPQTDPSAPSSSPSASSTSPSSDSPSSESSASATSTVTAIFLGIMVGVLGVIFAQYVYAKYKDRQRLQRESFAATEAALKIERLEDDL